MTDDSATPHRRVGAALGDPLVRRFAIRSLVVLLVVGLALGLLLARRVRDAHLSGAHAQAVASARMVAMEFARAGPPDLPVAGADLERIRDRVADHVEPAAIPEVNLWTDDGRLVFSLHDGSIGQRFPTKRQELARALSEGAYSDIVHDERRAEELHPVTSGTAFTTYVPVDLGAPSGSAAVLEVAQPYAPTASAIATGTWQVAAIVAAGLLALYLLLVPTMVATSRRLRLLLSHEHRANTQLREMDEMKNLFLSAVSHELRTPLTVVRGIAETLWARGHLLSPEQSALLLARLDEGTARLETLLTDLLDVDRLTRGAAALDPEPVALDRVARDVVDRMAAPDHRITVQTEPTAVLATPLHTERIVANLVGNALKYTPPGSTIEVSVTHTAGHGRLTVADDGAGIPEHVQDQVFEPFTRGHPDHPSPGTGVGLTLVAQFAALYGGVARAENAPNGGARFHVDFPLHPDPDHRRPGRADTVRSG